MVADKEVNNALLPAISNLVNNPAQMQELATNMKPLGKPEATLQIAQEVLKLVKA